MNNLIVYSRLRNRGTKKCICTRNISKRLFVLLKRGGSYRFSFNFLFCKRCECCKSSSEWYRYMHTFVFTSGNLPTNIHLYQLYVVTQYVFRNVWNSLKHILNNYSKLVRYKHYIFRNNATSLLEETTQQGSFAPNSCNTGVRAEEKTAEQPALCLAVGRESKIETYCAAEADFHDFFSLSLSL